MTTLRQLVEEAVADAALGFKEVAGAADLKSILSGRVTTPGCYVYRERATAKPNSTGTQLIVQSRTQYVGLLIATRSVQDARGGINADENEEFCDLIQDALLGLIVDEYHSPLEYAGGKLVLMANGLHYWQEIYYSTRNIRSR